MEEDFLKGMATSPEELAARKQGDGQNATAGAATTDDAAGTTEPLQEEGSAAATAPPAVDWLTEMNKTFGTQYKTADEIKPIFELPSKVKEYEEKVKVAEAYPEKEKSYQNRIKELESSLNPLTHFSSKEAYIAEQLRKAHPDKSQTLLQDVATKDLAKMDALDVLVNQVMLDNPDVSKEDARAHVYNEYGVDADTPEGEWSAAVKTKIKIKANEARKELNALKASVTLPEILTHEQVEQKRIEQIEALKKQIKPLQEKFAQFDKFTEKVGENEFEFAVPEDYKSQLSAMFEGFFVQGGNEINEDNLGVITELKEALMLKRNFANIYRAIETDVAARLKKEYDERLGNTQPPNGATATDFGAAPARVDGFEAFLKSV